MNFEVLKRSHLKRNILIAILAVALISSLILNFTQAKYRTTQSMPLIQGTINFSSSDLNIVAMYLNQDGAMPAGQVDIAPKFGYTLNEEQSICEVNDEKIVDASFTYENGMLGFYNLNRKGTKCTVYFDLIPDSEKPIINSIGRISTDTSLTITVYATDNIGVYYYYFKLDNGEEIKTEESSYTFEGLEKGQTYNVSVRVEDAAGNEASDSENITVGFYAKDAILAYEGGPEVIEGKEIPNFANAASTDEGMFASEDNDGISYYYRGAVNDNWLQFGTNSSGQLLYWRIVRVNGDGSIRLIYNGISTVATGSSTMISTGQVFNSSFNDNMYVGFKYTSNQVHGTETNSTILNTLNNWYANNLTDEAEYIDGNTGFCGDRTPSTNSSSSNGFGGTGTTMTYYGAYIRLVSNNNPSLQCDSQDIYTTTDSSNGNKSLQYPIGLVTTDEAALTGITYNNANTGSYLYTGQYYWTMSPYWYNGGLAGVSVVRGDGYLIWGGVNNNTSGVRPVINIRANVQLTGTGTTSDPFVVVS